MNKMLGSCMRFFHSLFHYLVHVDNTLHENLQFPQPTEPEPLCKNDHLVQNAV